MAELNNLKIGRVVASVATRYEKGRIIPNRLYVNYPAFMGSISKVINVTAAVDAEKISLDTQVRDPPRHKAPTAMFSKKCRSR